MKIYDKWLSALSLYAGGKESSCPVCGGKKLEHGYVILDTKKKQGYGALWCNDCMHAFCLSRVVLKDETDKSRVMTELPAGLIFN